MAYPYTPVDDIPKIRDSVKAAFKTNRTLDVAFRKEQLLQVAYMLQDNQERFEIALKGDLGRPSQETSLLEVGPIIAQALKAHKNVAKWAAPESVPFDLNTFAMGGKVLKYPQGVALIIGPFNYPLWCVLVPLIGAISAGCAAVIKPSEVSANVQTLLVELIPKYLDAELYQVVTAEIPGTTKLLELQWDHIMYTGNGPVGRIVATAAAKHLTPVSLELGGKSPVIVDDTADLALVARRVLWAKAANAGQTCIAPDYILVSSSRQPALLEAFATEYAKFYPDGAHKSESFSRLVAERHFDRLEKQLRESKGRIVLGGECVREEKFIAPTIVADVTPEDSLMAAELFGPILPIMTVKNLDDALSYVRDHDHPLIVYLFSNDAKHKKYVADNTSSGMYSCNDLIVGAAVDGLPFGGHGQSGYGAHSGKHGFDAFSHRRGMIDSPGWLDWIMGFRFPPYNDKKHATIKKLTVPKIPHARPGTRPSSLSSLLSFFFAPSRALALVAVLLALAARRRGVEFPGLEALKIGGKSA